MFTILTAIRNACLIMCLFMMPCLAAPVPTSPSHLGKEKIGSETWMETKLRQYPELLWLLEPSLAARQLQPSSSSYSQTLFSRNTPALDAALRSLVYLHLLAQGSRSAYSQFCQLQSADNTISLKQFQSMHKQFAHFLHAPKPCEDTLKILETAIILKHIGYSAKASSIFKPYFTEACARTFYTKALHVLKSFPELSPSFSRLSPEQREVLSTLRGLDNYDSLFVLTTVPNSRFFALGKSKKSLLLLDLYLYSFDVCGEQSYSKEFHQTFSPLLAMLQQHDTVEEAFSRYFTYRAQRLGFEGNSIQDMILVRLATLMQLSSTEAGCLSWSFKNLSSEEKQTFIDSFYTPQGEHIPLAIRGLPHLISGLLQTYQGTAPTTLENRLRHVYSTALSLIAKSLKTHRDMKEKHLLEKDTILDFSRTIDSSGGLDIFSENIAVRIHLNGAVSVAL